jgi:hypothetical protein
MPVAETNGGARSWPCTLRGLLRLMLSHRPYLTRTEQVAR